VALTSRTLKQAILVASVELVNGILDTAKDVITLVQKADNLELVKQVLALRAEIMK